MAGQNDFGTDAASAVLTVCFIVQRLYVPACQARGTGQSGMERVAENTFDVASAQLRNRPCSRLLVMQTDRGPRAIRQTPIAAAWISAEDNAAHRVGKVFRHVRNGN